VKVVVCSKPKAFGARLLLDEFKSTKDISDWVLAVIFYPVLFLFFVREAAEVLGPLEGHSELKGVEDVVHENGREAGFGLNEILPAVAVVDEVPKLLGRELLVQPSLGLLHLRFGQREGLRPVRLEHQALSDMDGDDLLAIEFEFLGFHGLKNLLEAVLVIEDGCFKGCAEVVLLELLLDVEGEAFAFQRFPHDGHVLGVEDEHGHVIEPVFVVLRPQGFAVHVLCLVEAVPEIWQLAFMPEAVTLLRQQPPLDFAQVLPEEVAELLAFVP
jgi:hypothetical protein